MVWEVPPVGKIRWDARMRGGTSRIFLGGKLLGWNAECVNCKGRRDAIKDGETHGLLDMTVAMCCCEEDQPDSWV